MDNVAFHRSVETKRAIDDNGYIALYILPYSPKLNAIEYVLFSAS